MIDDRAVSSAVSYALVIVVTVTLTTGLVLGTEQLVEDQREDAARQQLEVIGQQLSATVSAVDRMGTTDADPGQASVTRRFPSRVAGSTYRVAVEDTPRGYVLTLETDDGSVTVTVPLRAPHSANGVHESKVNGGSVSVRYDGTNDRVEVRNG